MREGEASRTSIKVAARRAAHQLLDTPRVFDDPFALRILPPHVAEDLERDPQKYDRSTIGRYLRAFLVVRSRFAEDELANAVARGVTQYVLLGAGFDTFSLRNPFDGLTVFELDHPATQRAKRARLASASLEPKPRTVFAPVDLATTSLDDALQRAGFDRTQRSLFSWLGVSMYLELEAIRATLRTIAALADATVVFDYAIKPAWYDLPSRTILGVMAKRVAAVGEPWVSFFRPDVMKRELASCGFRTIRDVGADELNARYLAGSRLRIGKLARMAVASTSPLTGGG